MNASVERLLSFVKLIDRMRTINFYYREDETNPAGGEDRTRERLVSVRETCGLCNRRSVCTSAGLAPALRCRTRTMAASTAISPFAEAHNNLTEALLALVAPPAGVALVRCAAPRRAADGGPGSDVGTTRLPSVSIPQTGTAHVSRTSHGNARLKVEPWPGTLTTVNSPPWAAASCREM